MKYLSLLLFCTILIISCNTEQKRVLSNDLTRVSTLEYYHSKPFTGVSFEMYDEKTLKEEYQLKDGQREGFYRRYHKNGKLEKEGNYQSGIQVGLWKGYYENGQLAEEMIMETGSGKEYFESGQLKFDYKVNKDGSWNGPWKRYYENGQLAEEGNYKDGMQVGLWKCYFENGQLDILHVKNYNSPK